MASLPNPGAPFPPPLSEEHLSLLISLSGSIPAPPQCTMNDIQFILSKISATIAQCRSSLALACSRVASDATCDGTSQVFNRQKYYYLHLHRCRRHHHHLDHRHHRLLFHTLSRLFIRPKLTGTHLLIVCFFLAPLTFFYVPAYCPCGRVQVLVPRRGVR